MRTEKAMGSPYQLTPSQIKILEMASDGFTDKEISQSLGISPGTLRTYWDRLRKRCDSRSRSEVIAKMQHRLSSKRLKLILLEKMPFYIWTMDETGKVDFCNEWFHSSGNLEPKEAARKGIDPLIVSEERSEFHRFLECAIKGTEICEGSWHISTDDGATRKRHKIRLIPMGATKKWICYAREIASDADHQMAQFLLAILS